MELGRCVRDPALEEEWVAEAAEVVWAVEAWDRVKSVFVPLAEPRSPMREVFPAVKRLAPSAAP